MDADTLELIRRCHEVFGAAGQPPELIGTDAERGQHDPTLSSGRAHRHYADKQLERAAVLRTTSGLDAELRHILAGVASSHEQGARESKAVLDAATEDHAVASDTPTGEREAAARKAAYLRAQHEILQRAQAQAQQATEQLRRLRYRMTGGGE